MSQQTSPPPIPPPPPSPNDAPTFESAWRSRFEEFATQSDDDAGIAGWSPSGLEARVRRFESLWDGGSAGECWLDVGCGAGTYTRLLLQRGLEVVGVDYSLVTVQKACARSGVFDRYVAADVASLPFQPQRFDGVLCFGVLQALGDSAPAIRELTAQLRPRGSLWVDALNCYCVIHAWEAIRRRLSGRGMHLRYESPRNVKAILARSGLRNVRLEWMPLVPRRWQRLQRMVETPLAKWLFNSVPLLGLVLCHAFIVRGEKPARAGRGDAGTTAPAS